MESMNDDWRIINLNNCLTEYVKEERIKDPFEEKKDFLECIKLAELAVKERKKKILTWEAQLKKDKYNYTLDKYYELILMLIQQIERIKINQLENLNKKIELHSKSDFIKFSTLAEEQKIFREWAFNQFQTILIDEEYFLRNVNKEMKKWYTDF